LENIDELISKTNEISDVNEKVQFILNYFLKNVRYNYGYLFAKGYAQGTISGVSDSFRIAKNKTRSEGDEEYSLTRSIIQGESKIFNDILQIRDDNSENYSSFIEKLRIYITKELSSHLGNETIVSQNVEAVIKKIEQGLRGKKKVNIKGTEYSLNYDISKVLIDFLLEAKKYFPPEFVEGILTNGVCEDYTDYLVPLLQKMGIEAHEVEGTSELKHAWVIVKVGNKYKSIDLTRAVFIRDGFLGIPAEQTSQDWLYSDLSKIFEMQSTRTIKKIDDIALPKAITPENFDEQHFIELMEQIKQGKITDSTLEQISEKALNDGLSKNDSEKANQYEQGLINKEEVKSEH